MKKALMFILVILVFIIGPMNLFNVAAVSSNPYEKVAKQYFNIMRNVKTEWQNAKISDIIKLKDGDGNTKAFLYRIKNNKTYAGYFVVDSLNGKITVSEATLSGEDPLVKNPKAEYYIEPFGFYTKSEYNNYMEEVIEKYQKADILNYVPDSINFVETGLVTLNSDPLDPSNLVPVPSSYYSSYYISYYSEQLITSTPQYFNYPFGPVNNGCGATTAAMLVSFYDLTVLHSLYTGTLPLDHRTPNGPDPSVDALIITMAGYLQTCSNIDGDLTDGNNCTGTSTEHALNGLNNYFSDKGYNLYHSHYINDTSEFISDYSQLIQATNVSYLKLAHYADPLDLDDYSWFHAVLGIGLCNIYGIGHQLIVRYNHLDKDNEYMISPDLLVGIIYMSKAV